MRERFRIAIHLITHPLDALGALIFLAALEGMSGASSGAQRLLHGVATILIVALIACIIAIGVWISAAGYGVQLWIAIGLACIAIYLAMHLRWQQ
jgi:hypothetical protein